MSLNRKFIFFAVIKPPDCYLVHILSVSGPEVFTGGFDNDSG